MQYHGTLEREERVVGGREEVAGIRKGPYFLTLNLRYGVYHMDH